MSNTETKRRIISDAATTNDGVANAAIVTAAVQPPPTIWHRPQQAFKRSWGWLYANWILIVCLSIAARIAYSATITLLYLPLQADPYRNAETNAHMGYAVAFIFYMIAAFAVRNARVARVARVLPFGFGALYCTGYNVWLIFLAKNPEYGMCFVVGVWGTVLLSLCYCMWMVGSGSSLVVSDVKPLPPERPTTVGNSKFADRRHIYSANLTDDWIEGEANE